MKKEKADLQLLVRKLGGQIIVFDVFSSTYSTKTIEKIKIPV